MKTSILNRGKNVQRNSVSFKYSIAGCFLTKVEILQGPAYLQDKVHPWVLMVAPGVHLQAVCLQAAE